MNTDSWRDRIKNFLKHAVELVMEGALEVIDIF